MWVANDVPWFNSHLISACSAARCRVVCGVMFPGWLDNIVTDIATVVVVRSERCSCSLTPEEVRL